MTDASPDPKGGRKVGAWLFRLWCRILNFASGEWLLTRSNFPNGSGVIVLRSLLAALWIYLLALGIRNLVDPTRTWMPSGVELMTQVRDSLHWYGTFFGAVAAALYARFAAQWRYLANTYNQIKAAECRTDGEDEPLAEWKAAFIEDAEDLHLACKPAFASVLRAWGKDDNVQKKFKKNAPGGGQRFDALMTRIKTALQEAAEQR